MTTIAAQMDRDPVSARLFTRHCRRNHTRLRRPSRLPDRRDVIDVDVKTCSHWFLVLSALFFAFCLDAASRKITSTKLKVQSSRRSPVVHGANGSVVDTATGLLPNESNLAQHLETVAEQTDLASLVMVPSNWYFAQP